jgi:hypothetical protein
MTALQSARRTRCAGLMLRSAFADTDDAIVYRFDQGGNLFDHTEGASR